MKPARRPVKRVLVTYEPSREGDAALGYALDIARTAGATLTVVSVTPQERTDVGCASCRASARAWNEQLRLLAHERLSTAAKTIGDSPAVQYLAACGPERQVLAQAARQYEADIVVVPWRRAERLRRVVRLSLAEHLSQQGPWEVAIAPRTASSPPPRPEPRGATAPAAWQPVTTPSTIDSRPQPDEVEDLAARFSRRTPADRPCGSTRSRRAARLLRIASAAVWKPTQPPPAEQERSSGRG
jgi:nucleotide-binding universal stress UspA family protein